MQSKYVIIIPDSAADEPCDALDGLTPLGAADTPQMDAVASSGRIGTMRTIPRGLSADSDVAVLSILGYDPVKCYTGRGPIEALARNIDVQREDVVFRCNLVTLVDSVMADSTAGFIRSEEAALVMASLNASMADRGVRFYGGMSYRGLMVVRDPAMSDAVCMMPHDLVGESISGYLPTGPGGGRLREIMAEAAPIVAEHDVNWVRRDVGETPATSIWPWGQGVSPILRRFRQTYGIAGAAVGATDMMHGIAKLMGWPWVRPPGATGDMATDYEAKGLAAIAAIETHDLVTVHVDAACQAGYVGDAIAKVSAIEAIDRWIVGPILERLRRLDAWRILIASGCVRSTRRHQNLDAPSPFCMAGTNIPQGLHGGGFSEAVAAGSDLRIEKGSELMEYFLRA